MFELELNYDLRGVKFMIFVKENIKKGLIILLIYSLITFCLFMASNRIQRLENMSDVLMCLFK